jgi:hypothetical protein
LLLDITPASCCCPLNGSNIYPMLLPLHLCLLQQQQQQQQQLLLLLLPHLYLQQQLLPLLMLLSLLLPLLGCQHHQLLLLLLLLRTEHAAVASDYLCWVLTLVNWLLSCMACFQVNAFPAACSRGTCAFQAYAMASMSILLTGSLRESNASGCYGCDKLGQ